MADYFTQFSCILNVGSTENAARANDIRGELATELDREEGATLGFAMTVDHETGPGALWLHSDEYGEPEHVITFVLRCAEALGLDGVWGFSWSHSCSRPRADAFGGGAHVIDLGKRHDSRYRLQQLHLRTDRRSGPKHGGGAAMIRSFLDASSGHLSLDTWSWLNANLADDVIRNAANGTAASIAGGKTRYGWFVYAPEDAVEGLPEDLVAVQLRARQQGAEYVLFDCDAPPVPGLPILHPDFRD